MAKQPGNTKAKKLKPDTSDLSTYLIPVENPRKLNQLYVNEFSGLTPNNLHYYLEAARKGLNFWKSLLFEEIRRRDLRIGGVCQTRKLGVTKEEWQIRYKENSPVPEDQQKEQLAFIENNIEGINFVQFISDIVEAQIQGVSTFELMFKILDNKIYVDEVCYIPNHLLLFNDLKREYRYLKADQSDAMRLRTMGWNTLEDRIDITPLQLEGVNPLKIIEVESLDGTSQNGFLNGCIDSLIWAFLFKNYGIKDWSIYVERFASPGVVGKYPPLLNKQDKAKLFEAVRNWGNLFKATIPDSCTLDLITDTAKASTQILFDKYVAYWDKNIGIRVLGQSLTTDIGDVGSKAAAQTHDEVREDLKLSDMILVSHAVNILIRRLIDFNFPGVKGYPVFEYPKAEDLERKLKKSEIIKNLKESGYRPTQEYLQNEFGMELEEITQEDTTPQGQQNYIDNFIEEFFNGIHR